MEAYDHSVKSREFHISIKASSHESHAIDEDMDDTDVEMEQGTWENVVYLPFGQNWNYLIVSTTIFNFGMNCMNIVYKLSAESYVPTVLYYAFETIYLIHTIAQLIHKKAVTLRKKRYYHAVSTTILCLNMLSLFPFFETYFLLNVYTWDYRPPVDKTRLKVGVRLLPVFTYCTSKKRDVGVEQIVVVVLNQVLIMSLIITILSCTWYQFKNFTDPDRVEGNWVYYLRDYQYQKNNTVHWMIICVHVISSFFAHNALGPAYGVSPAEKIFILIIMFCGFFLFFMIFFGELTAAYIQTYWHHYEYTARLKKIVYLLNDWRVDKEVQKKTIEYYTVFWERRLGMKDMPVAFEMLPISMRKDVTMDIFWDSFRHSHIFENTSIAVKRSISTVMKNEFLLPGDYLMRTGQLKTKMVYIVSGVVQVLTDEDNESPVLSFSSGTLLGETCCLRAIVSQANVKCATYCELHTLHMVDLYRVLSNNIEMARYFIHCAATRVEEAKRIREDVTAIRRGLGFDNDDTSIMRLKKQWRLVSSLVTGKKYDESMWKKLDKTFNSKFLDLMVLSQEVELKVQAVCLSSKCPPVMDPNSSFRVFCEYIIIGSACIQFVLVPFAVFFASSIQRNVKNIIYVLDLCYYLDIYIQLSTAVKLKDQLISNPRDILFYRLKQMSFIVDVFSTIPYASLVDFFITSEYVVYGALPRIIKIYKIFVLINMKEKSLWTNNVYMKFIKYFVLSLICLYCATCIMYMITCTSEGCKPYSWFNVSGYNIKNTTASEHFAISFLYATALFFRHSITKLTGYVMMDITMTTLIMLLGYFMYCFVMSELTTSAVLQVKKVYAHQDEMQVMKSIMERRLIGLDLYSRFVNILDFNWHYNEGAEIQGPNGIFNDGSEKLKTEIINERIASVLRMVPLFDVLGNDLIRCLSMNMRVTILPAGTPLVEHGATVLTVYVILRGYCSMRSHLPGDRERRVVITLKKGDILAPIEMLHRLYSVSSVATITAVEIMQMPYDVFKDILRSHRAEYQFIQQTLQEHLHVYHNLLQRTSCRLPVLKSLKPALGKTDAFEYKIITRKERIGRDEYLKPFQEIEWGCVRYLMMRTTVNPKSKVFLCWEITRTITIIADIVATILSVYILREYTYYTDFALTVSRSAAAIDIYIRFHCQYYNINGILVTHPLYTAKYYLHGAFFTDVISALPLTFMQLAEMFGINNLTRSKGIIRLVTRPIQLYRPFLGISYLESSLHWSKGSILMKIRYTGLLFVVLGIYANVILLYTCEYYTINSKHVVNCTATNNWLSRSNLTQISHSSFMNFAQTVYLTVSIFANTLCGTYKNFTTSETKAFILIVTSLHMLRIVVLAKFISSTVGGNINLSIYQARMKQFLKFAKEVKMSYNLIKETIAHNEYVWKETQGTSVVDVCNKLNLYLRVKFVCFLYEDTLRSSSLFVALSQYCLQRLALNLAEVHFKKDAEIIRCNDVQSNLYIVYKGRVDVTIANVVISTLEVGGIFGCFSRGGLLRQTLTVTAKVHTIVLVIDSKDFHKVMMPWENEQARKVIRDIRLLKLEYIEPFVGSRELVTETGKTIHGLAVCYNWLITKVNQKINQESFWFWLWEYMLNVHISVLSSIGVLVCLCVSTSGDNTFLAWMCLNSLDALYLTKVFFGFTLQYVDVNTGVVQRQPKKIVFRYLKSWFLFDILTCLPFEELFYFSDTLIKYSDFGFTNRVFRYFYIVHYYTKCNYRLNISKHLRWTCLIYRSLFYTQVMVTVWILCACFRSRCAYVDINGFKTFTTNTLDSILVAYTYILNLFTSTGLNNVRPMSLREVVVATFVVSYVQYTIAALGSGYVTLIIIENTILSNYKYNIERLNIYLKSHYLSPAILQNVWAYLLQLWKIQRGEWMPMLIRNAPSYLRQDIMKSLYMSHLENHFLFGKTHKHFLKQLVVHFERCIYFPGNYIVAKGDIDNTIYFIHKGEVGAYDCDEYNREIYLHTLGTNMSFGEAQGINQSPFEVSYKALSTAEVLALRKANWEYLLAWFPASEEELIRKSEEYGLRTGSGMRAEEQIEF